MVDSFKLSDDFSIVEVQLPKKYDGKMIREIDIKQEYNLLVLTTISKQKTKAIIGKTKEINKVQGVARPDDILSSDDLLVVYGANKDIKRLLNDV